MIHSASFLSKDACTQEIYICNEFIRKTSLTVTSVYINEKCATRSLNSHDGRGCSVNGRCPIICRSCLSILFCFLNR